MFWAPGSLHMEYIKVHKKIETILWTFDKEKKLFETKNKSHVRPHASFKCFKHIKGLLKHGEFSWIFCSHKFEIIKTYFKI